MRSRTRESAYAAEGWATLPFVPSTTGKERTARRKAEGKAVAQTKRNRRLLAQVHHEAREVALAGKRIPSDPADAVQEVLDAMLAMWRHAWLEVQTLEETDYWRETIAGKIPHEWIREHERLGLQIVHVASKATAMGVAERRVRLDEAKAILFAGIVDTVMKEFNVPQDQRIQMHERIAAGLDDLAAGVDVEVKELVA